jgi:hypothetical protein
VSNNPNVKIWTEITFKPEEWVTYCHKDFPGIRYKDIYGNRPHWAFDVRSDNGSGLPPMPAVRNLDGTRYERMLVERQYKMQWKNNSDLGGLTNRHRSEVLSYLSRIAEYALDIGATKEDLNHMIDLAIKRNDR